MSLLPNIFIRNLHQEKSAVFKWVLCDVAGVVTAQADPAGADECGRKI